MKTSRDARFGGLRLLGVLALTVMLCCCGGSGGGGDDDAYEGACLSFDGMDDVVFVTDRNNALDLGSAFTLEAMVWPNLSVGPTGYRGILQNGGGWILSLHDAPLGRWSARVCGAATCGEAISDVAHYLTAGEFQHVAVTYDGATITIYRNGQVAGTAALAVVPDDTGSDVEIGRFVQNFDGLIDEIRIWSVARTQVQIQADQARRLSGNEAGLVAYFNCDEGTGQVIQDGTVNDLDGILGGSTAPLEASDPQWVIPGAPTP